MKHKHVFVHFIITLMLAIPMMAQAVPPPGIPPTNDNSLNARVAQLEATVASLLDALAAEEAARIAADDAEASARITGDNNLQAQIDTIDSTALEARLSSVEDTLTCASYDSTNMDFVLEGCNVHVRNGAGITDSINGLGNLIVGYDAERTASPSDKTGSHNMVIGDRHNYTSYGGLVAGLNNAITGTWASVSGGGVNEASGHLSSVTGGQTNTASGQQSSISGGIRNTASGGASSISGGNNNTASGTWASVTGGLSNEADGDWSSISGGSGNRVFFFARFSSISGGLNNTASGNLSSISGGRGNSAGGAYSSILGGNGHSTSTDDETIPAIPTP
jgi:hypothetical protein